MQIIEREFSVDLSEWMRAFDNFHANLAPSVESRDEGDISKNINIQIDGDKKDKSYLLPLILLGLIVAVFVAYFIYNNFGDSSDSRAENRAEQSAINPAVNVDSVVISDIMKDSSDLKRDSSEDSSDSPKDSAPKNISNDSQKNDSQIAPQEPTLATNINATQFIELIFTPNEPLWIGVINLNTKRKKQVSTSDKYSIILNSDKLIRTGHSHFGLSDGRDYNKQFIGGDSKFLLYTINEGLREITHSEFVALNGGAEW